MVKKPVPLPKPRLRGVDEERLIERPLGQKRQVIERWPSLLTMMRRDNGGARDQPSQPVLRGWARWRARGRPWMVIVFALVLLMVVMLWREAGR